VPVGAQFEFLQWVATRPSPGRARTTRKRRKRTIRMPDLDSAFGFSKNLKHAHRQRMVQTKAAKRCVARRYERNAGNKPRPAAQAGISSRELATNVQSPPPGHRKQQRMAEYTPPTLAMRGLAILRLGTGQWKALRETRRKGVRFSLIFSHEVAQGIRFHSADKTGHTRCASIARNTIATPVGRGHASAQRSKIRARKREARA